MKIKTSALTGVALDWAVAKCEGGLYQPTSAVRKSFWIWPDPGKYSRITPHYSTDWARGGPIIEREMIGTVPTDRLDSLKWCATMNPDQDIFFEADGPTPLIAAMRCLVASKLGDEVEIPEELL